MSATDRSALTPALPFDERFDRTLRAMGLPARQLAETLARRMPGPRGSTFDSECGNWAGKLSKWRRGHSVPHAFDTQFLPVLKIIHQETARLRGSPRLKDPGPTTDEIEEWREAWRRAGHLRRQKRDALRSRGENLAASSNQGTDPHPSPDEQAPRASDHDLDAPGDGLRKELLAFLKGLIDDQRSGTVNPLPRYLPLGVDVLRISRSVRVRQRIRSGEREAPGALEQTEPGTGWSIEDPRQGEGAPAPATGFINRISPEQPLRTSLLDEGVPWSRMATEHPRICVLGDAGMGKSWLLRTETLRLAQAVVRAISGGTDLATVSVPLVTRCDKLVVALENEVDPAAAVVEAASKGYGASAELKQFLVRRVKEGGAVLLFDALDELRETGRRQFFDALPAFREAQTVITSRVAGYDGIHAADWARTEVELLPFTDPQINTFIHAWGLEPEAAHATRMALRNHRLAALARVPLLAALICAIVQQGEELPKSRSLALKPVLRRFLSGQQNMHPLTRQRIDAMLAVLAALSFDLATRAHPWREEMTYDQIMDWCRGNWKRHKELGWSSPQQAADALTVRSGLLIPLGTELDGADPDYIFVHRSFGEYLSAHTLARTHGRKRQDVILSQRLFDARWEEVVVLAAAQAPDVGQFLDWLVEGRHDPLRRLTLLAARAAADVPDVGGRAPRSVHTLVRRLWRAHRNGLLFDSVRDRLIALGVDGWPPDVATFFRQRLQGDDRNERLLAIGALTFDTEASSVALLLAAFRDRDPVVHTAAAAALELRTDPPTMDGLVELLSSSPVARIRQLAAEVLARRADLDVEHLQKAADDKDDAVRLAVYRGLLSVSSDVPVDILELALRDHSPSVRYAVLPEALRLSGPAATRTLGNSARTDTDARVRLRALTLLADVNHPTAAHELIALLSRGLPRRDVTLGGDAREVLVQALSRRPVDEVVGPLSTLVRSKDFDVRLVAVDVIGELHGESATRLRRSLLTEEWWWARYVAAHGLAAARDETTTDALLLALETETVPRIRGTLVAGLAGRATEKVHDAVLRESSSSNPWVRSVAQRILGMTEELPMTHDERLTEIQGGRGAADPVEELPDPGDLGARDLIDLITGYNAQKGPPDSQQWLHVATVVERGWVRFTDAERVLLSAALDEFSNRFEVREPSPVSGLGASVPPAGHHASQGR